jgi:hypothetical protein
MIPSDILLHHLQAICWRVNPSRKTVQSSINNPVLEIAKESTNAVKPMTVSPLSNRNCQIQEQHDRQPSRVRSLVNYSRQLLLALSLLETPAMPPKRKLPAPTPAAVPTKRATRRDTVATATRKAEEPASSVTPPSTNQTPRVVRTYGRTSQRQQTLPATKMNSAAAEEEELSGDASEDELLISPKKPPSTRSPSPAKTRRGRVATTNSAKPSQPSMKSAKSTQIPTTAQRVTRSRHAPEPQQERVPSPLPATPKKRGRQPAKKLEPSQPSASALNDTPASAEQVSRLSPSPLPVTPKRGRAAAKKAGRQPSPPIVEDPTPLAVQEKVVRVPQKRKVEVVLPAASTRTRRATASAQPETASKMPSPDIPDAPEPEDEPPAKKRKVVASRPRSPSPLPSNVLPIVPPPPASPTKKPIAASFTPRSSPTKSSPTKRNVQASPTRSQAQPVPEHLVESFEEQKRSILRTLSEPSALRALSQHAPTDEDEEPTTNDKATRQIADLLEGSITRSEGNSCLLLGPKGSGKSQVSSISISSIA